MSILLKTALGLGLLMSLATFAPAADDKAAPEKASIDKLIRQVQALQRDVTALKADQDRPATPVCPFGGPGLGRGPGAGRGAGPGVGPAYVDRDGDGVCDNLPRARSAGGPGLGRGPGAGRGAGRGIGPAYVDRDGDGVCDNLQKARAAAVNAGDASSAPVGRAWGGPGMGRGRGWGMGGWGMGPGQGRGPGWGRGSGPGFVDADRDGLCDRFEERTGKH